jgi:hypothetical protein
VGTEGGAGSFGVRLRQDIMHPSTRIATGFRMDVLRNIESGLSFTA